MRAIWVAAVSAAALLAVGPQARAEVWNLDFAGGNGVAVDLSITAVPNVAPADPNSACGTGVNNPCRTDPAGAYMITGISGTFTDTGATTPIINASITGLIPINPANERDPVFDALVPSSLSFLDFTNEATPADALSYNDLLFPDGSPIDCAFPFVGTQFDVFGVAFHLSNGDSAVLWGDGNYEGGPLTYGVGVTDGANELDYQFAGVSQVPEPGSMWLLASGLVGLVGWKRKSARVRA